MGKEFTKEQFAETLEVLGNTIQNENDAKVKPLLEELMKEHDHLDLTNPEQFELFDSLAIQTQADYAARISVQMFLEQKGITEVDRKQRHELECVWEHRDFITTHLEKVIVEYEGHACSADKSRWIVNRLVDYILTGDYPEDIATEKQHYWHPDAGSFVNWIAFAHSMIELYYGNPERYVNLREDIIEEEHYYAVEKFNKAEAALVADTHFIESGIEDNKVAFYYEDQSGDSGEILLDKRGGTFYRFTNTSGEKLRRDDTPQWFQDLLDATH